MRLAEDDVIGVDAPVDRAARRDQRIAHAGLDQIAGPDGVERNEHDARVAEFEYRHAYISVLGFVETLGHVDRQLRGLRQARAELGERIRQVLQRIRSAEHTSELQSLMRISYAVF